MTQLKLYGILSLMSKTKHKFVIIEGLAKAIEESGLSCYRIGKDTGINKAVLSHIVNGGSCSMETADILCRYFDLELKPKQSKNEVKK